MEPIGSIEPASARQWTTGRILRLVAPPALVLSVALAIRECERPPAPPGPPVGTDSARQAPEASLAPAPANRVVILAEDATSLATALRARLAADVAIVAVPGSQRDELAREWGIVRLPAVVIERPGRERVVCDGDDATDDAVVQRCRELGLPVAEDSRR